MTQAVERSAETAAEDDPPVARSRWGRRLRITGVVAVLALFTVELVLGWSSLAGAFRQLRTPHVGWLVLATLAEVAAMGAYARMQGRLLRSAGVRASRLDNIRLTYAAHSLNETLPGGAAFSTRLNYQQMRRFGASPAIASWTIALSGILSSVALAAVTVGSALAAGGGADWTHLAALLVATIVLILGARRVAKRPESAEALIRTPLAAVNRLRHRPAEHGQDSIRDFLQQLRAARLRPAHGAAAAILAVANWFLDAICLWLCFRAVGEQPAGLTAVLLAFCAAMAAGTITIVPGGLGIIDSALILGLMAGGVTTPAAVATVVLYRIISFGFIIGLGWLSWLHIRHTTTHQPSPLVLTPPTAIPALTAAPTLAAALPLTAAPALTVPAISTAPAVAAVPTLASAPALTFASAPATARSPLLPAAVDPALTPAAIDPALTPAAADPALTPAATEPALTPAALALFPTAAAMALIPHARKRAKNSDDSARPPAANMPPASSRRLAASPKGNAAKANASLTPETNAARVTASLTTETNAARATASLTTETNAAKAIASLTTETNVARATASLTTETNAAKAAASLTAEGDAAKISASLAAEAWAGVGVSPEGNAPTAGLPRPRRANGAKAALPPSMRPTAEAEPGVCLLPCL